MAYLWHSYFMARTENQLKTVPFKFSTTPHVVELLRELVNTGLYGKNTSEAAERLLAHSLGQLVHEKRLSPPRRRT